MLNLIVCATNYKGKLAIGKDNALLFKLKEDLEIFKNITHGNTIIMGRKTWDSLPARPLKNRTNLILTRNKRLLRSKSNDNYRYISWEIFNKEYRNKDIFVIGGSEIYDLFISIADRLYLTHVESKLNLEPDTFFNLSFDFKLIGWSEKYTEKNIKYRILIYNKSKESGESNYLNLAKKILEYGNSRDDRTGVGTLSVFGETLRFDISNGTFPLLTTRQTGLKQIVEELLFFCRGDTNAKILDRKGVKIWNGNTSREFLDKRGLRHYSEGVMGPNYGWMWRYFGAEYNPDFSDSSKYGNRVTGGFDQLKNVENLLRTDPFSRRIYISNLNPAKAHEMCIDCCHVYVQFYVTQKNNKRYLSGYFTMRSSDSLAWHYNICSYTLLVNILALRCNMEPLEVIYNAGDCHIYRNHIEQIKEQLTRTPRPFPKIHLNPDLKSKDWSEMEFKDFELIGYFPYNSIKMKMAV